MNRTKKYPRQYCGKSADTAKRYKLLIERISEILKMIKLKELRMSAGLPIRALSELAGVSKITLEESKPVVAD